jgi:hypothetical protein
MAEHVQEALDQMVAPLRDLMDRNIFSEVEIKAIVSRRRESEYLLRRRAARKADFLRYIEAEQLLEELRRIRSEQRKRDHRKSQQQRPEDVDSDDESDNKGNKKKEEQHIGDVHIMQHIHLLFVRAIRKFRSDLSLHLLHVDFCKKYKSWTRLGKVYAETLQIFPRKAGLWIEAASHEFFGPRRSIRSARILMQRGLRILPNAQDMWVEYFSLELHFAQTLKGRKQILMKGHGVQEMEEVKEEKDPDADDNEDYKIATIVYKNAIKAIPDSIPFRLRFLDTCRRFPDTQNLMNSIQEPLQKDFSSQPEAWIARAYHVMQQALPTTSADDESTSRPKKKAKSKDPVVAVLEEGIETVDSQEMNLQAFRFAQRYLDEQEQEGSKDDSTVQIQELINTILKQSTRQVDSPELALEQAEYYISRGEDDMAVLVFETFCTGSSKAKSVAPASLWIRWASLSVDDNAEGARILKKALDRIPLDRKDYFHVLLQFFGCLLRQKEEPDRSLLNDTFQRVILLAPTTWDVVVEDASDYWFGIESVAHAYLEYLNRVESAFGLKSARRVYNTVLFQSTVQINENSVEYMKAFMDKSLKLEKSNRTQLRRLYDQVVQILEGTPLEKQYRQERNDSIIYQ